MVFWVALRALLRTGAALAFFQCSGTSPGLHGLSKVLESGLAATSAASALAGASRGAHAFVAVRFVSPVSSLILLGRGQVFLSPDVLTSSLGSSLLFVPMTLSE